MPRTPARLAVLPAALALLLPLAGTAAAHVTVQPPTAEQGSYAKLTFRVPNEGDSATTRLEVAFPAEHPFSSARVKPHAGWTAQVTRTPAPDGDGQVVQRITWDAAAGGGIAPDEFDEFEVSLGPLPEDADSLLFPALQTYADGEVVRWIEPTEAGAPEPEKPAPTLTLVAASDTGTDAHGAGTSTDAPDTQPVAAVTDDDGTDGLAAAALVVASLALVVGGVAAVRPRRAR